MKNQLSALAAIAALSVLAGCGGSGGGDSTAGSSTAVVMDSFVDVVAARIATTAENSEAAPLDNVTPTTPENKVAVLIR